MKYAALFILTATVFPFAKIMYVLGLGSVVDELRYKVDGDAAHQSDHEFCRQYPAYRGSSGQR